jgi:hypothetical protein
MLRKPASSDRSADAADVIASVKFARENGLLTAIRGGSHNVLGLGTCNASWRCPRHHRHRWSVALRWQGYLSLRFGLTLDNLLEADVVLADGSLLVANESENSDLFWALRAGGGNFGVVISFSVSPSPDPHRHSRPGSVAPPAWQGGSALLRYLHGAPPAPETISGIFASFGFLQGLRSRSIFRERICVASCFATPVRTKSLKMFTGHSAASLHQRSGC